MPIICRFLGIVIAMYFKDHAPPHFHAKYGGQEALVHIETGESEGYLPPRAMGLVQEWRQLHHDELLDLWTDAQSGNPLHTIDPLE